MTANETKEIIKDLERIIEMLRNQADRVDAVQMNLEFNTSYATKEQDEKDN